MKKILLALFLLGPSPAFAQNINIYCFNGASFSGAATFTPCPGQLVTTNGSVTITTGATFQNVLAASSTRKSLTIENNNTSTDNCYVFVGSGSATEGKSILLTKGGSYQRYFPFVPSDVIQATCDNTSDTLYIDTQ